MPGSLVTISLVFSIAAVSTSRPPSRCVQVQGCRLPSDEQLGFDAAVVALGLKANISEAQHPLICEGTRKQKSELAIAMMVHYKDDQYKLDKVCLTAILSRPGIFIMKLLL